jgi:hypothetical protein
MRQPPNQMGLSKLTGLQVYESEKPFEFYYPDQQVHNIYINNILYIISTSTCFNTSAAVKHVGVLVINKIL